MYCYAEFDVSSLEVAVTIANIHCASIKRDPDIIDCDFKKD